MEDYMMNSKSMGDIYRMIYQNRGSSRQELSKKLNLSLPTVTGNLNSLRTLGLIRSRGSLKSTGGRKPAVYHCVPDARYALGIDITKNHLSIVLIDLGLNIISSKRIRIVYEETGEYFNTIRMEIENTLKPAYRAKLLGAGVSLPAIVGADQKSVTYATVIRTSSHIYEKLSACTDVPVLLFNDANSAGLAESWKADYAEPMAYLSLSSSVGGASVNRREIYTGANWRSCEFGHMTIVPRGKRCYCGKYGCLDAYCSSNVLSDFTGGDLKQFFAELKSGKNRGLRNVFDQYMDDLAIAVNNLRLCYDCNIVLGGYVGAYMTDYIDIFREKAIALNPFEQDPSFIRVCHYRTEASAVGAAIYYVNQFIQSV